uniref:Uncharacterized protein n=1 Tax=Anguilla anguilla TaxID=7936 RepID=A0A0E9REF1_ANGAN
MTATQGQKNNWISVLCLI